MERAGKGRSGLFGSSLIFKKKEEEEEEDHLLLELEALDLDPPVRFFENLSILFLFSLSLKKNFTCSACHLRRRRVPSSLLLFPHHFLLPLPPFFLPLYSLSVSPQFPSRSSSTQIERERKVFFSLKKKVLFFLFSCSSHLLTY